MRQQGAGLTGTLVDNTRQITASADDLAEGVLRRLLRRGARPALSANPTAVDGDALLHTGASTDDGDGAANDP
jgi:hypothetical protein